MKENAWVVVANAEKAKIYRVVRIGEMQEIIQFEHPERLLKGVDIFSDREGRAFNRVGVSRHAYQPQTTENDKADNNFARDISEYLDLSFDLNKFSNLYVVAAPHFLGVLKKHLSPAVQKKVDKFFSKDIVNVTPVDIWEICEIV
jgi:protein required for attachment to host cells